jgi:hypothetical protein
MANIESELEADTREFFAEHFVKSDESRPLDELVALEDYSQSVTPRRLEVSTGTDTHDCVADEEIGICATQEKMEICEALEDNSQPVTPRKLEVCTGTATCDSVAGEEIGIRATPEKYEALAEIPPFPIDPLRGDSQLEAAPTPILVDTPQYLQTVPEGSVLAKTKPT